ncbi:hypothetical protein MMC18_003612 [Xylographa bjoerkii]|nr:hypothetical protein [Xylographa bjoerkii]
MERLHSRVRFRDKVKRIWSPDEQGKKSVEAPIGSQQPSILSGPAQSLSAGEGRLPQKPPLARQVRLRGLWDDAYDKITSSSESKYLRGFAKTLREDVRARSKIDIGNIQGLSTVISASPELSICRQVLSIVQKQASMSEQEKRHIPSKDATIKECCGEIAASVQKFVDVGDIVAQVDPVHIGLPWAGISCPAQGDLLEGLIQNLITLYGSMLLFILEAQLHFGQHSATRALTATIKTSRLQGILDDITENEAFVQRFERLQLRKDANEQYLAIRKILGSYDDYLQETLRKEILAWISDMDYGGQHKGILERLMPGTSEWLFQKGQYIRWQQSASSALLWLRGDGKSSGKLVHYIKSLIRGYELILELMKVEYTKVTIIIDALDECQSQQREKLLRFLTRLIKESDAVLKILVSSRDGTEIADHFDIVGSLHIDASDNEADIRQYVDAQIETRLLSGKANHETKARVKTLLNLKAQGMFRWVELQVESLCDPDYVQCEVDVEDTARKLPQTLEAVYLETLEKFNSYRETKRDAIDNALKLLLCTERTLKVDELLEAVSVGLDG